MDLQRSEQKGFCGLEGGVVLEQIGQITAAMVAQSNNPPVAHGRGVCAGSEIAQEGGRGEVGGGSLGEPVTRRRMRWKVVSPTPIMT